MVPKSVMKKMIVDAMNAVSDTEIDPAQGREQMAAAIADAVEAYVIGRTTLVTGTSPAGPVTGQGIIQ